MVDTFYRSFEERYRGSRQLIKERLSVYVPFVQTLLTCCPNPSALDIGCGRGEWLETLRDQKFEAIGVDQDAGMLQACRELGLSVLQREALGYLRDVPDESLAVISAFHVVEHIAFDNVRTLVAEAHRALKPGGLLILETPNPENIAVGTSGFYLDPTHQRPLPKELLSFVPEFYGFHRVKVMRLQESTALAQSDAPTLSDVLGGASPDYSVVAQKLAESDILHLFDELFQRDYGLPLQTLAVRHDAANKGRLQVLEHKADLHESRLDELATSLGAFKSMGRYLEQLKIQSESQREALIRQGELNTETQQMFGLLLADLLQRNHEALQTILMDAAARERDAEIAARQSLLELQRSHDALSEMLRIEKESSIENQQAAARLVAQAYESNRETLQTIFVEFADKDREFESVLAKLNERTEVLTASLFREKDSLVELERNMRMELGLIHDQTRQDMLLFVKQIGGLQRQFAETVQRIRDAAAKERRDFQLEWECREAQWRTVQVDQRESHERREIRLHSLLAERRDELERIRAEHLERERLERSKTDDVINEMRTSLDALTAQQVDAERRYSTTLLELGSEARQARLELNEKLEEIRRLSIAVAEHQRSIDRRLAHPIKNLFGWLRNRKTEVVLPRQVEVRQAELLAQSDPASRAADVALKTNAPSDLNHYVTVTKNVGKNEVHGDSPMTILESADDLLGLNDRSFVEACYRNLLGRHPDQDGLAYYLLRLRSGHSKGSILLQIVTSTEARQFTSPLLGLKAVLKRERRTQHWFWGYFERRSQRARKLNVLANELGRICAQFEQLETKTDGLSNALAKLTAELPARVDCTAGIHEQFERLEAKADRLSLGLASLSCKFSEPTACAVAAQLPVNPASPGTTVTWTTSTLDGWLDRAAISRVRDLIVKGKHKV